MHSFRNSLRTRVGRLLPTLPVAWRTWAAIVALALTASVVRAQEAAPAPPANPAVLYGNAVQQRLSDVPWGGVMQLVGAILLSLAWTASADWVNRDTQIFGLGFKKWNPIIFFPFVAIFLLLAFLPVPWWLRLLLLFLAYLIPSIIYVVIHNKSVQPHQTVLTGPWWRHFFASLMSRGGVKVSGERLADYEKGAAVELLAYGAADANSNNANLLIARQSPGYLLVKDLIAEMVGRRAEKTRLEYGPQGVVVRYEIDGVWHPGDPRDRESADVMLAVMKTLANLDAKERRKKQTGQFGAKFEGASYLCPLSAQGVQNGELVIASITNAKNRPHTYASLGIRDALRDQWMEVMAADRGLAIFSTMPGGGLTTLADASLEETDRLMRDFVAIEEASKRERELQNIAVHTYDAAKGESPATLMPTLIRSYPNVYIVRDFVDPESAKILLNEINDERLVVTTIRARDAVDALLRILATKIPQKQFAAGVSGVLYQRLIRKLCVDCRVGYPPSADILKKLGIPAGKVQQFYRPPKQEEVEKPCLKCKGIGYLGRTGIFELLIVNDEMRAILASNPTAELLRKSAREAQQRSLQEEGILLVAKGVTSLPELQRALKGE